MRIVRQAFAYVQRQSYNISNFSMLQVGTLFGLMIRPATRMGYHRDPESLPISPFEKEMRRRAWSLAFQLDLLIS